MSRQILGSTMAWSSRIGPLNDLPVPGPVMGSYPIRPLSTMPASPWRAWLAAWWAAPSMVSASWHLQAMHRVREAANQWKDLPDQERTSALARLRGRLMERGLRGAVLDQALGTCVGEVERRLQWHLHDTQILAARGMLGGRLMEMATGEGKTVTVVLAAAAAALAGVPVHVMTANDYLAQRDASQWRPIYDGLGLSVSSISASSTPQERHAAYQKPVVYVTAREVAFDHLRDRAAKAGGQEQGVVLRGLCMAIVDEADSILIDEACTPLLLAQEMPGRAHEQTLRTAMFMAGQLRMGVDMAHDKADAVNLLPQGQEALTRLVEPLGGAWRLRRYREDQVHLALTAIHVLKRDVHYLVQGDEVQIIDGTTGRLAIGRSWSRGLHQMVCIKERLALPAQTETLTQATYQTFFPRYHRVCGLSGTLWEERGELLGVYGLPVVRVASRFESGRLDLGLLMCASQTEQWLAVASQVRAMVEQGRAVLIGTDTVADSEALAEVLTSMAIPHALLNARHDGEGGDAERMVIEAAGGPGQVTVATHMAGRGTDIRVHPDVLARGGLHVINTHLNPSGRIDRQLRGRCARQGQPGSHQRILSLDDSTLKPWMRRAWFRWLASWGMRTSPRVLAWCCAWAQRQASLQARWQRWAMLQLELGMRKPLALSGRRDWV